MEAAPSGPLTSSRLSSSATTTTTTTRLSSVKLASPEAQNTSTESRCMLSFEPFVKKYAWAVVGALIAISGSVVLLACSSSSKQAARRCSAAQAARGFAAQEVRIRSRAVHSQGTNTDAPESETITTHTQRGKATMIVDADVCSAVPELIIRDTSYNSSPPTVHALIDTDTLDRSAPLTIYSSLTCPASDTIRRPVSWSEPYIHKEEVEAYTSYHSQAIEEPLKPTPPPPYTHTPTQRKSIPILHHDKTIPTLDPSSSSSPCLLPTPSLFSSKFKDTVDTYPCFALSWTKVRIDLFLLLSILSCIFYYFYLRRDGHTHIDIHQQVKPFPVFRLFP